MAVIQTSKILMRRGAEVELPGAPTSLSPLVFPIGLDIGEFGYAVDTGRLWIGHAPNYGQANYKRTAAPYQNVEVLTEASTDTVRKMFNFLRRDVGQGGFYTAALIPTDEWADITIESTLGVSRPYRFPGIHVIAKVEYYVVLDYQEGQEHHADPVRQGTLRILSNNGIEATISDECMSVRRTDLTAPASIDAQAVYDNIEFRVVASTEGGARYFAFQYRSSLLYKARVYFDVARPTSEINNQY